MKPSVTGVLIAVLVLIILAAVAWIVWDKRTAPPASILSTLDSLKKERMVDSMVKDMVRNVYIDTAGLSEAPVKVLSFKFITEEYSSYKSVRLSWKNISKKRINAIRFKWYGLNAFNEPADMGTGFSGLGGGYTDDPLSPGQSDAGTYSSITRDGKKLVLAWPYEVVFADGAKWKIGK